jgi:lipopolysaccharide/colanic/teichoic acid biosynthesis glycosyltransferase
MDSAGLRRDVEDAPIREGVEVTNGDKAGNHVLGPERVPDASSGGAVALQPGFAQDRSDEFAQRRSSGRAADWSKRAFDLVGAAFLIIILAPLWIAIALLIKVDSPGPILFRQRRVGRDGRPFSMFKFRTMVDGADAQKPALLHLNEAGDGLFKIDKDPRVTGTGRWLRATSLDELPQLLHVVTGRMSLVGPRPLVPEEDAQVQGKYRCRHFIRPGMTGPWQVGGASAIPIQEMVKLDQAYVENWSLWLDVKLLGRTAPHVIGRRGI